MLQTLVAANRFGVKIGRADAKLLLEEFDAATFPAAGIAMHEISEVSAHLLHSTANPS